MRRAIAILILFTCSFLSAVAIGQVSATSSTSNFAINFFQKIAQSHLQENFVLSGASLEAVLLMLQEGAGGNTQQELSLALCGSAQPCQKVISKQKNYDVANAIWIQEGLTIKPDYLSTIKNRYQGEILSADFQKNPSRAAGQVNQWADKNTHGMIKDIIQPNEIDKSTAMILANALYFQGFWPVEFDASKTENLEFATLDNKKVSVPTMTKKDDYYVANQNGIQFIGLPYRDSQLEMVLMMPVENKSYSEFVNALSAEKIQALVSAQKKTELTLFMPKFSITSSYTDLKSTLQSLGLRTIFTVRADLTKINDQVPLSLDKVLQKAVIIVDEKGTKAAAVTAGIVVMKAVLMPRIIRVDRPFVFAIVDRNSRDILFMGQVVNPAK